MERLAQLSTEILSGGLFGVFAQSSLAVEVLTKDEFVNKVVKKEQLVKVAASTSGWSSSEWARIVRLRH